MSSGRASAWSRHGPERGGAVIEIPKRQGELHHRADLVQLELELR